MDENKLNTFNIYSIADTLNTKLQELGILNECLLSFTVKNDELKKIDEDIFYRFNKDSKDFIPSDNSIKIKYGNINIQINKENN